MNKAILIVPSVTGIRIFHQTYSTDGDLIQSTLIRRFATNKSVEAWKWAHEMGVMFNCDVDQDTD